MVNTIHPDLFVSIHINSSKKPTLAGIETFCLHEKLFKGHTAFKQDAQLQKRRKLLYQHSHQAAVALHDALLVQARTVYPQVKDRAIRHKVPQVLFGINSPGVLLELGYLSNQQEGRLLQDPRYQQALVYGMANGIARYFQ